MAIKEVQIPDIGGAENVDVIEILVAAGDQVAKDESLLTLEGDKATMEIPSPYAGKVTEVKVAVGDKVSEGSLVLSLEVVEDAATDVAESTPAEAKSAGPVEQRVVIPDIGGAENVDIIEITMKAGEEVAKDDSLLTLEGDKATMEIPSPYAGKITEILVKVGDKVSAGTEIAVMLAEVEVEAASPAPVQQAETAPTQARSAAQSSAPAQSSTVLATPKPEAEIYAGPAVRRIAREFGVQLNRVLGTGRKGRILTEDIKRYVKEQLGKVQSGQAGGFAVTDLPEIDFSQFGPIEKKPLTKIQKLSGANLSRNWMMIPHVTQHEEADITELEAYRKANKGKAEAQGFKLTPLVFLMQAVAKCLADLPQFNASLDNSGEQLIMKQYFHIGVAVDTPNGLVVPVIRDVDKKDSMTIAEELGAISKKAREKGLSVKEMQGSSMTISSLGGIGGTAFTPIVNWPDVAILGVSRSSMQPVYQDDEFVPRLMLPLSLSYDHRVIDGAVAARFVVQLKKYLEDISWLD